MQKPTLVVLISAALVVGGSPALAKGHIAGAAVGAVVAPKHHKVAGAVIGGAVGHHMAKTKEKKAAAGAK